MRLCFCAIGSTRAARRQLDGNVRGFPACTRSYLGFLFVVVMRMLFSG